MSSSGVLVVRRILRQYISITPRKKRVVFKYLAEKPDYIRDENNKGDPCNKTGNFY